MMNVNPIILTLLLILPFSSTYGQHQKLQNLPYADQRLFHLGFTLGVHTQDIVLTQSGNVTENGEEWYAEVPRYSPGFSAGIIADLFLSDRLNLRFLPTLHLGEKRVVFREFHSGEEFITRLRNNYISVPVHLKVSADRIDNFRPYVVLGGYGSVELASRKGEAILLKPFDAGIEVGIGCDFYLPLFKLSPELKLGFGLVDILETDRPDLVDEGLQKYAQALSKATQRLITLSFHFE